MQRLVQTKECEGDKRGCKGVAGPQGCRAAAHGCGVRFSIRDERGGRGGRFFFHSGLRMKGSADGGHLPA